jgi:hypothetical protein
MKTRREAIHFLKGAEHQTGKRCTVRPVERAARVEPITQWKIFTSEDDWRSYRDTGRHRR